MVVVSVGCESYYMNAKLKAKWDKIKEGRLKRLDTDRIYIVDGRERTGKSVFAFQNACYIDPSLATEEGLKRICFTPEEFLKAIKDTNSTTTETKAIVFDEAFRGLASRAAMSKINKKIIAALMEVGQKNLVIFIVLPSFFMLDLYAAMLRSSALFHVKKELNSNKRYYLVYSYNKKGQLYQSGVRKGWKYAVATKFKDYFFNKYPNGKAFEDMYRAKKLKALHDSQKELETDKVDDKYLLQRDLMIGFIIKNKLFTQNELARQLRKIGFKLSQPNIALIFKNFESNIKKTGVLDEEHTEKELILSEKSGKTS